MYCKQAMNRQSQGTVCANAFWQKEVRQALELQRFTELPSGGPSRSMAHEAWQGADHRGRALAIRYGLCFYPESNGRCLEVGGPRVHDRICFGKQVTPQPFGDCFGRGRGEDPPPAPELWQVDASDTGLERRVGRLGEGHWKQPGQK